MRRCASGVVSGGWTVLIRCVCFFECRIWISAVSSIFGVSAQNATRVCKVHTSVGVGAQGQKQTGVQGRLADYHVCIRSKPSFYGILR
ncbi:hypothetical protein B0H11DRAFT_698576 [Mycena galericulata]|nr:hypothetical protein B0H11DRAFT_808391 [Mycena galericulata]KAJ7434829.1 hypothetical protein B0H11DRAFT_698576 [Mycena galericulata]